MKSRLNLETIPSGKAPGQLLRTARQSMGLTVDDVAAELRLAPDQITALEENDFKQLAGQTYVRGYIRSYARMVDLPAEHIVPSGDDKRFATEDSDSVAPPPRRKFKRSSSPAKLLTYVFLILLVGLVMAWWYQRAGIAPRGAGEQLGAMPPLKVAVVANGDLPTVDRILRDNARESRVEPATLGPDALLVMAEEEYAAPDIVTDGPADTESPKSVEPETASDAIGSPAPDTATDSSADPESPGPVEPEAASDAISTPGSVVAPDPVAPEPVMIETAAAMPATIKQLVLYFAAPTWADVRDAQSQLLLAETVTPGQVVVLQGTPPFAVNIGQAAGVRVGYEGKLYNVTPRNDDPSARFSVGKFDLP